MLYLNSCFFDQLWFYSLKWKYHLECYEYFLRFINNRKRCLTARSQDYLPIGSHKNKFVFRSQNLLIFFKNFGKRKFREFPEFRGSFRKFIMHTRKFIHVIFLDLSFAKVVHAVSQYFYEYNKIRVLRKMKLLYLQKVIWQNFFLLGIRVSTSMQNLKTLRFFELAKVSLSKVSFAKINIFL